MKNKCSDLKRLWDRASKQGTASKAQKISSTSTPTPTSIEVENRVEHQNVNNPPSNELQLALVQTHNNSGREPEIGSPIVEDEELDEELDDEAVYVLEPDPGKRIPIINYDVNDQDLVRRRYIAMGACKPKKHEFETTKIGDGLSQALQRRDQDIVNAIDLISLTKQQLLNLREDSGWELFLQNVESFCLKHKIKVPDMDGFYKPVQRSKKFYKNVKNLHRFRIDMFLALIDRQLQELNGRFDEVNTELLVCMASFNPVDSFAAYDQEKLVKLAQFYPLDFSKTEMLKLPYQLSMFVADVRRDQRFRKVKNIAQLSAMLVETKKSISYDIVYKLLKLVLILPVATASVERVFSSMNYVKNKLRAKMGEQYLNDCLVTFLERKFFMQVKEDAIISRFQKGDHRVIL